MMAGVGDVGAGEEYQDYQYPDWGVDRVDLDFKSGPDLSCKTLPVRTHDYHYNRVIWFKRQI